MPQSTEIPIFLSLGSNLGARLENLFLAVERLESIFPPGKGRSSVYLTAAWGKEDQADFLNMALGLKTSLEPVLCLEKIQAIERAMGREKEIKWGPRKIDIDIIYFGDKSIKMPGLQIPHPERVKRRFVLEPLCEIFGEFVDPEFGLSLNELLGQCLDQQKVKRLYALP